MLHAGRGRSFGHKNRKPQGTGTPTPTPTVGNQLKPANMAAAYTMYTTTAVAGDVIDMDGAWFTPGAPYKWIFTKSFAAPGITLNCHASQVMQFFGDTIVAGRTRVVGANLGADVILGNTTSSTNHAVQLNFCTMFAFVGCFQTDTSFFGIYTRGCSDITERNNIIRFVRHDGLRHDESLTRADIRNNYVADNCTRFRVWYKADNTTPLYRTDTQAGYIQFDPDHPDGTQSYLGTWTDTLYQYNYLKTNNGQALFNSDANHLRAIFDNNTLISSIPYAAWVGMSAGASDVTFTNNTISKHPDYDPNSGNQNINIDTGANPLRIGLNIFNAGTTNAQNAATLSNLAGPITGSVAATNPPTWSTDGATVGTIPSKLGGVAFVPYAGAKLMVNPPDLVMDGTAAPWASGCYIKAIAGNVKMPSGAIYGFWDTMWTRWFLDGAQQAVGQGLAATVSPLTTAGSWTAQQSLDSTNGVDGNWSTISAAAVVADAFNSLTTGIGNITYSNSNRTAVRNTSDAATIVPSLNGRTAGASAKYVFEITPTQVSGGDVYFGITDGTRRILINGANMYGGVIGSESSAAGFGGGLFPTGLKDGTDKFTILWDALNQKIWVKSNTNGWLGSGGDPNGGGTGFDISLVALTGTVKAYVTVTKVGDTGAFNFGQVAFATVPTSTAF